VAAFGVLALAIGLSVMLDARRRTVSTAVLRAVGLTPRAVFGALAIEYAVVLVCGTVLGTFMGLQLGSIMLQFLEVTETGAPVIPPFILETRWGVLAIAGVGLLVVTVGSVVAGGVYLRRVAVARAIRLSE
ncbi:MAG TPA: FtsX-like permease family protein, partial [Tepidiformaceae bacterium]|nr:FtsX-like permease family protein [Tepidiformaceae bacterium]